MDFFPINLNFYALLSYPGHRTGLPELPIALFCGDGRTRTAVQTPHRAAFYTLSLTLVFDQELPSDRPLKTYPLRLGGD